MVCGFTGHRPEKLPWGTNESDPLCQALKLRIFQEVEQAADDGADVFCCGMARGCDLYFAEAVLQLKKSETDSPVGGLAALSGTGGPLG